MIKESELEANSDGFIIHPKSGTKYYYRSFFSPVGVKDIMDTNKMDIAFSEWWQFYNAIEQMCNKDKPEGEWRVPIISLEICQFCGL